MAEDITALDAVMNALSVVLERRGGGMATGTFVVAAEILLPDGGHATYLITPPDQPTHRTLGLVRYADEAYGTEVRIQLARYLLDEEGDE